MTNLKIRTRLAIGFGIILILTLVMGIVAILETQKLADNTLKIYQHPFTVSNTVRDIKIDILTIRHAIKEVILAENIEQITAATAIVKRHEHAIYKNFNIVSIYFLGEQNDVRAALDAFSNWKAIQDEIIHAITIGKRDEAINMLNDEKTKHLRIMDNKIQNMIDFASNKGIEFSEKTQKHSQEAIFKMLIMFILIFTASLSIALMISFSITSPLTKMVDKVRKIAKGYLNVQVNIDGRDEIASLAKSINQMSNMFLDITKQVEIIVKGNYYSSNIVPRSENDELSFMLKNMTEVLKNISEENEKQNWLKTGKNELNNVVRNDLEIKELCQNIISFLAKYIPAQIGALYLYYEVSMTLKKKANYACKNSINSKEIFQLGEGLIGQAALEKKIILINDVPKYYTKISSATGNNLPSHIVIIPFFYQGKLEGIIELASFQTFSPLIMEFLESVATITSIAVNSAQTRLQMKLVLEESQAQSEELISQQEELKQTNEELTIQAISLRKNQEELQIQKESLQVANDSLTKIQHEFKNKALALTKSNKYKSDFLANMSHELRTPLNSMLLLSQQLSQNEEANLSNIQVESAQIIYNSGKDLLNLINKILDLSKIEAGKMSINVEKVWLSEIANIISTNFKPIINEKKLDFSVNLSKDLPKFIITDHQKLHQILNNLISNALKFTVDGSITVNLHRLNFNDGQLDAKQMVVFSVLDTGIGIPQDKQNEIFEAFQQLDSGIARKYGGTGLGLSISKELAKLLGGVLQISSIDKKGSTFSLFLPENIEESQSIDNLQINFEEKIASDLISIDEIKIDDENKHFPCIKDDLAQISPDDKVILIIEDDLNFAKVLYRFAKNRGFKSIHAADGKRGIELAEKYALDAILLDIRLPKVDGWHVFEHIKDNLTIRHIPIHIISVEDNPLQLLNKGAIGFLSKPVNEKMLQLVFDKIESLITKKLKQVLVIEDNNELIVGIEELLSDDEVNIVIAHNGNDAIAYIQENQYDCIILDLVLPDISGFDLLKKMKEKNISIPPIIVYTGKTLTYQEHIQLQKYANSIVLKGVQSNERLLDETTLFLHQAIKNLPTYKQHIISKLHEQISVKDKKILIVDDDVRNIFALSNILEKKGMIIYKANNGQECLELLDKTPDIDLVIMDIMMPIMDGYEAIEAIRKQKKFEKLPIITLTAKAMKEDYKKSIMAGANDYLKKPVEIEQLLSVMKVWLHE